MSFNERFAAKITSGVATMWCAYAFAALALVSLPNVISSGDVQAIVAWVAQTFLQLVLLSVIMVGQKQGHEDVKAHVTEHHRALHDRLSRMVGD